MKRPIRDSNLQLKATYKQATNAIVLDEILELDAKNKITGSYNFINEEAVFSYTYTTGTWSAAAKYNFQTDSSTYSVTKKQGKANLSASFSPRSEDATLKWAQKPYTITAKSKIGQSGVGIKGIDLMYTHTWNL